MIEAETHSTDQNSATVTESHHQKEQLIIENPSDPLSTVTHRLEDVHVTVDNEASTPTIQEIGLLLYLNIH